MMMEYYVCFFNSHNLIYCNKENVYPVVFGENPFTKHDEHFESTVLQNKDK